MFHAIKRVFDPKGLLNPGKGVPALSRCAEFGRKHMKDGTQTAGQLGHPGLPRF
jgi:glycolate oxidase